MKAPHRYRFISTSIALAAALTLWACGGDAKKILEKGDTAYIRADNINLRSGPSTKSKRLGMFSMGKEVKVLERSKTKTTIGKNSDYWYKIKHGQYEGWIFGYWITSQKVASASAMKKALSGTYWMCNPEGDQCTDGAIYITGSSYTQTIMNEKVGITDQYSGTVLFGHNEIWLRPKSRQSRGSYYGRKTDNAYDSEVKTQSVEALSALGLTLKAGRKAYRVYRCKAGEKTRTYLVANKKFRVSSKLEKCALLEKAYIKK